jgi:hypothetical protein
VGVSYERGTPVGFYSIPHSGLRRDFLWIIHRLSVTLSVGTTLCPYAYRRVVCLIAYGLFTNPFEVRCVALGENIEDKVRLFLQI